MNTLRIIAVFMFTVALFLPSSVAIGLSPSHRLLEFSPGGTHTIDFQVYGVRDPVIYVEGDLADHITTTVALRSEHSASFTAKLTFPNQLAPGTYKTVVGVREPVPSGETAVARTAVQSPIIVTVNPPAEESPSLFGLTFFAWAIVGLLVLINVVLFLRNSLS